MEVNISNEIYKELNQYVLGVKNLLSASAASTFIIHNDCIVNEWYTGIHDITETGRLVDAESKFNIASTRKTYLGFAISLALHEGRIKSINDYVTEYLDDLNKDLMGTTTIRHLLTHTHGLQGHNKRVFSPGTDWQYNNAGVNLLIKIIHKVFDKPLASVMEERLFSPYGFTQTAWVKEKNDKLIWLDEDYIGNQGSDANLFVSTKELALWGYIHLTKGKYMGRQILPSSIFEQAVEIVTPSHLDEILPRNGFFWWVQDKARAMSELGSEVPVGSYQSLGFYGNAVLVIPEYNAVAVRMLNQIAPNPPEYDYIKDIQNFGDIVCKCILLHKSIMKSRD
ncbi:class A beta-lactamase-related serine hydrolase [Paenibacillus psychroresistens]|uniref:Class A beta-lactamase-related serine hydrolase n=1 Tax=Paenibacillus psychroresistens TaxID=1778678 RepID=A0A6B8REG7_9BACL|nr:serine hydrolase domain-containing protein [Paenibacillus psychroresistens]QGQ93862.1 class A beta-lactamase-related serine hydrolase [Paenibacillus psychroresistens]